MVGATIAIKTVAQVVNLNKAEKSTAQSSRGDEGKRHEGAPGRGATKGIEHLSPEQQQIIKNAESISTAKPGQQATKPRNFNEQVLWNQVLRDPGKGGVLRGMNNDKRFPESAGFQKMEAKHKLPDGEGISIHYQYNRITGKAYDIKITSPQRNTLQPGPSIKE